MAEFGRRRVLGLTAKGTLLASALTPSELVAAARRPSQRGGHEAEPVSAGGQGAYRAKELRAVSRPMAAKLDDIGLSINDFGPVGRDGQAALAAAVSGNDKVITIPGVFGITGVVLSEYGKLRGQNGGALMRTSGNDALLTVPDNRAGLQTVSFAAVQDIGLQGNAGDQRAGTGLKVGNNAALQLDNVAIRGCKVGLDLREGQFLSMRVLKVFDNDIGMVARPSSKNGGANSLTLTHFVAVGNTVGLLFDNTRTSGPQIDIVLVNPQVIGNTVCGLAVVGQSTHVRTQVYIYGMAPEANAIGSPYPGLPIGAPSYTSEGVTVPRSSIYLKFAHLSVIGGTFSEYSHTDPCVILESATLSLHDADGYGGPAGVFVKADAASSVIISGYYGCVGACHGVTAFSGSLSPVASQGALVGSMPRRVDHGLPNVLVDPEIGGFTTAIGVASQSIQISEWGRAAVVAFRALPGSSETNVARFDLRIDHGDRVLVAMTIMSDRSCRLRLSINPNDGPVYIDVRAGEETRFVYWVNGIEAGSRPFCLYPIGSEGPTIRLSAGHAMSGRLENPVFAAACNAVAGGAYNPRIPALVPYGASSVKPVSDAYPVGAVVHNAAPRAGEASSWQHVGKGVWKAMMLTN